MSFFKVDVSQLSNRMSVVNLEPREDCRRETGTRSGTGEICPDNTLALRRYEGQLFEVVLPLVSTPRMSTDRPLLTLALS